MKTPILIYVENSYIDIYETLDEAENTLEAIDVEDDLFKGFDAEGRLLKIEPYESIAKITEAESEPTHQAELIALLKKDMTDHRNSVLEDDLSSLIARKLNRKKGIF
jgi:hypothetical protein